MSEGRKHLSQFAQYLVGNVVDLGSGGMPIVPHAIQVELPVADFCRYNAGAEPHVPIQWRGDALDLPFKDNTVDAVFSSHLIEDFADPSIPLKEWCRVVKPLGHLVILAPERSAWRYYLANGGLPNDAHKHEPILGELSGFCRHFGFEAIEDRMASDADYSLLYIGRKIST